MALSYRFNRYVNEQRETVMPIVASAMNEHSGVATSEEDLGFIFDKFLDFRSYQDDGTTTYDPESDLYWGRSADYYVTQSSESAGGRGLQTSEPTRRVVRQVPGPDGPAGVGRRAA